MRDLEEITTEPVFNLDGSIPLESHSVTKKDMQEAEPWSVPHIDHPDLVKLVTDHGFSEEEIIEVRVGEYKISEEWEIYAREDVIGDKIYQEFVLIKDTSNAGDNTQRGKIFYLRFEGENNHNRERQRELLIEDSYDIRNRFLEEYKPAKEKLRTWAKKFGTVFAAVPSLAIIMIKGVETMAKMCNVDLPSLDFSSDAILACGTAMTLGVIGVSTYVAHTYTNQEGNQIEGKYQNMLTAKNAIPGSKALLYISRNVWQEAVSEPIMISDRHRQLSRYK